MGDETGIACGNCRRPMRVLRLDGHYGQPVEIDVCAPCHLLWFDAVESARLTGPGMLELLGAMAQAQVEPHEVLHPKVRCPRCAGALKTVHNQSRWGRTTQLECVRRHGLFQTFAQYLTEKGLLRPFAAADRAALIAREGSLGCLNCGAGLGAGDERCRYCGTVPGLFDVARLAASLDPEGATQRQAVHGAAARHTAMHCLACGAPLPHDRSVQCAQCGATLAVGRLREAHGAVRGLEAALRAHQQKPAPHVVADRLARIQGDLPRRREWARQMEAEAQARRGGFDAGEETDLVEDLREHPWRTLAAAALFVLLMWFLWG